MLERLLDRVEAGGTMEVGALAAELGTSPAMIEAMLDHLERRGSVQRCVSPASVCAACGLGASCDIKPEDRMRLWQGTLDGAH